MVIVYIVDSHNNVDVCRQVQTAQSATFSCDADDADQKFQATTGNSRQLGTSDAMFVKTEPMRTTLKYCLRNTVQKS